MDMQVFGNEKKRSLVSGRIVGDTTLGQQCIHCSEIFSTARFKCLNPESYSEHPQSSKHTEMHTTLMSDLAQWDNADMMVYEFGGCYQDIVASILLPFRSPTLGEVSCHVCLIPNPKKVCEIINIYCFELLYCEGNLSHNNR